MLANAVLLQVLLEFGSNELNAKIDLVTGAPVASVECFFGFMAFKRSTRRCNIEKYTKQMFFKGGFLAFWA